MLPRLTVITGNGKGKTTAAMGRAVLAAWSGERVLVVQFLKGTGYTGELTAAEHWSGRLVIRQFGAGCLHMAEIRDGLGECRRCGNCFRANKLPENRFVDQALPKVRLVLTGRNMPQALLALADEATECEMVKHPISQGIFGRWGVEY